MCCEVSHFVKILMPPKKRIKQARRGRASRREGNYAQTERRNRKRQQALHVRGSSLEVAIESMAKVVPLIHFADQPCERSEGGKRCWRAVLAKSRAPESGRTKVTTKLGKASAKK